MSQQVYLSQNYSFQYENQIPDNIQYFKDIYHSKSEQGSNLLPQKRNKPITKSDKKEKKGGRPKNSDEHKEYTKQSNNFSVAIYHFSRAILFLHLLGNEDERKQQALSLNQSQAVRFNQAFQFMGLDNFPSFQQWKLTFLLHPNSLHAFLKHLKELGVHQVTSQTMKMYIFACFYRRNLLTPNIVKYVSNFWPQIIKLVKRSLSFKVKNKSKNKQRYVQQEQRNSDSKSDLENQLKEDNSIAAYEIACYIKASCEISKIHFRK